ncbi:hypothetical protein HK101_007581 [Irineochytrium annulatum]|nr:hypothetical protein HK101_007581 [Irineochytrium annulatum]
MMLAAAHDLSKLSGQGDEKSAAVITLDILPDIKLLDKEGTGGLVGMAWRSVADGIPHLEDRPADDACPPVYAIRSDDALLASSIPLSILHRAGTSAKAAAGIILWDAGLMDGNGQTLESTSPARSSTNGDGAEASPSAAATTLWINSQVEEHDRMQRLLQSGTSTSAASRDVYEAEDPAALSPTAQDYIGIAPLDSTEFMSPVEDVEDRDQQHELFLLDEEIADEVIADAASCEGAFRSIHNLDRPTFTPLGLSFSERQPMEPTLLSLSYQSSLQYFDAAESMADSVDDIQQREALPSSSQLDHDGRIIDPNADDGGKVCHISVLQATLRDFQSSPRSLYSNPPLFFEFEAPSIERQPLLQQPCLQQQASRFEQQQTPGSPSDTISSTDGTTTPLTRSVDEEYKCAFAEEDEEGRVATVVEEGDMANHVAPGSPILTILSTRSDVEKSVVENAEEDYDSYLAAVVKENVDNRTEPGPSVYPTRCKVKSYGFASAEEDVEGHVVDVVQHDDVEAGFLVPLTCSEVESRAISSAEEDEVITLAW